jgi:membrane protease YdiL (CAAX protease family)
MPVVIDSRGDLVVGALLKFFSLTYLVTWTCWAAAAALSHGTASAGPTLSGFEPLFLLGVFAPSLVALALTARTGGSAAALALLRRMFEWHVDARWYAFAVGYVAAIKLAVAIVHRVAFGEWPLFGREAWYVMAGAIVISTWVQAGEEIGWRGYALPRLAARLGLGPASLLLGVIWACWHLPLFLVAGTNTSGQSFPVYLLQVTALSVAMGWLYWRTDGSLLLVMLMHAAINNTKDIVPSAVAAATDPFTLSSSRVAWLTVALLWVGAAYFLWAVRAGHDELQDEHDTGSRGLHLGVGDGEAISGSVGHTLLAAAVDMEVVDLAS